MKEIDNFKYTYSVIFDDSSTSEEEWLESLSPYILDAYNEDTIYKNDQEDY